MGLPSPSTLLSIPGYSAWYPGQEDAFLQLISWVHSTNRFVGVSCATGSGKSILALLTAHLSGARTVIVTATKGLQRQYMVSATPLGGVIVEGQNNFRCDLVPSLRADEGPCHEGIPCTIKETGCSYRRQLRLALSAPIVITNYAYYLAQTNYSTGLGDIGLLICDESHMAFGSMESYLSISVYRQDTEPMGIFFPAGDAIDQWTVWRTWSANHAPAAKDVVTELEAKVRAAQSESSDHRAPSAMVRALRTAKSVLAKLERLSSIGDDWVVETIRSGYRFTPKWVATYADQLYQKVPKIALVSAILSRKTAESVGADMDSCSWVEARSHFPPENTPIWHIPTVRLNHRMDDYGSIAWSSRIDQIIQRRLDRKGLIFTVSYDRARLLLANSRFKHLMFTHSTNDVVQVVKKFKEAPAPAILVSPTVTTGWDFPSDETGCRYIIIGKMPIPDTRDPVMKARKKDDETWVWHLAIDVFVQEAGRCSRKITNKCEVLIVDDSFLWLYWNNKHFAPLWFQERVKGSLTTVPDPLVP